MKFLQVQLTPNKTTRAGNYPLIVSNDPAQCSIDTFTQESLITPDNIFIDLANNGVLQIPPDELEEIPCVGCSCCEEPTSDDPSTVEYYGYWSSPTSCACVAAGASCNPFKVTTAGGVVKNGYKCVLTNEPLTNVQCYTSSFASGLQACGVISIPCPTTCTPDKWNFIGSKIFVNIFGSQALASVVGGADDDARLTRGDGTTRWFRSGLPDRPACQAGNINYQFIAEPNEIFLIEGYDTFGGNGGLNICVTFTQL
jgi:hypothetical protein